MKTFTPDSRLPDIILPIFKANPGFLPQTLLFILEVAPERHKRHLIARDDMRQKDFLQPCRLEVKEGLEHLEVQLIELGRKQDFFYCHTFPPHD